jgi:hypothetical protein
VRDAPQVHDFVNDAVMRFMPDRPHRQNLGREVISIGSSKRPGGGDHVGKRVNIARFEPILHLCPGPILPKLLRSLRHGKKVCQISPCFHVRSKNRKMSSLTTFQPAALASWISQEHKDAALSVEKETLRTFRAHFTVNALATQQGLGRS